MDTWTKAEITSEQKNFLLLSARYKIMFTHMCARTRTRIHTWVDWAWSPESSSEGRHQTRCVLGAGAGVGLLPTQPFLRGLGPWLRQSECRHIDGCWGAKKAAWKMSLLGICRSSLAGVSATCGQLALLPVMAGAAGGGCLHPYLLCAPRCAMGF